MLSQHAQLAGRVDPARIAFKLDGCIEIEKQYSKIKYDKKQYGEQKVAILAKSSSGFHGHVIKLEHTMLQLLSDFPVTQPKKDDECGPHQTTLCSRRA